MKHLQSLFVLLLALSGCTAGPSVEGDRAYSTSTFEEAYAQTRIGPEAIDTTLYDLDGTRLHGTSIETGRAYAAASNLMEDVEALAWLGLDHADSLEQVIALGRNRATYEEWRAQMSPSAVFAGAAPIDPRSPGASGVEDLDAISPLQLEEASIGTIESLLELGGAQRAAVGCDRWEERECTYCSVGSIVCTDCWPGDRGWECYRR